jgi:hypothetical protein
MQLTRGNLRRTADMAASYARLDGREQIGPEDVRLA